MTAAASRNPGPSKNNVMASMSFAYDPAQRCITVRQCFGLSGAFECVETLLPAGLGPGLAKDLDRALAQEAIARRGMLPASERVL
jgi:hypothetical protein